MRNVFDVRRGRCYWAASDIGWVVGHSYIVYAPLLARLHHRPLRGQAGGHPRRRARSGGSCAEHGVSTLFTAPTAFRAIKQRGPRGRLMPTTTSPASHALPRRRALRPRHPAVGERRAQRPGRRPLVADRDRLADRGQSASGWNAAGEIRLADACPCRAATEGPGRGRPAQCRPARSATSWSELPLPPGSLPTLWNATSAFETLPRRTTPATTRPPTPATSTRTATSSSWPHRRRDQRCRAPAFDRRDGGGLRPHPDVAECAVIGVRRRAQGRSPRLGRAEGRVETADDGRARGRLVARVRERSARSQRSALLRRRRLPKTRSGKILRGTLRQMASGEEPRVPATIEDPAVLDEVAAVLERREAQPQRSGRASNG